VRQQCEPHQLDDQGAEQGPDRRLRGAAATLRYLHWWPSITRFGAFEAIAYSSIKLARAAPEEDRAMDVLVAEAILEFADDLRTADEAVGT